MTVDQTPKRATTLIFALLMVTSTMAVGMSAMMTASASGGGPYVIAGTDYTDYDVGDTVHAEASSYDLTIGQNYSLYWTLTVSNTTVDSGNFSWTAFGNWSQESINWSSLSMDWHCFNVDLYEENATGSQLLDSDNACFDVNAVSPAEWLSTYSSGYLANSTTPYNVTIYMHNLDINNTYFYNWEFMDLDSGVVSENSSDILFDPTFNYQYFYLQTGANTLWDGCWQFTAQLGDNDTGVILDTDYHTFAVNAYCGSGTGIEWLSVDFGSSAQPGIYGPHFNNISMVNVSVVAHDLDPNMTDGYYLSINLDNGSGDYWINWWFNGSSTYTYDISNEIDADGCWSVYASLWDGGAMEYASHPTVMFSVGDEFACGGTNQTNPYVIAGTDNTEYEEDDIVHAEAGSHNLAINQTYSLNWTLTGSGWTLAAGNFTWVAYNSSSEESVDFNASLQGSGSYLCFNVDLYEEEANGSQWLDSDNACFSVVDGNQSGGNQTGNYEWISVDFMNEVPNNPYHHYDNADDVNINMTMHGLFEGAEYNMSYNLSHMDSAGGWTDVYLPAEHFFYGMDDDMGGPVSFYVTNGSQNAFEHEFYAGCWNIDVELFNDTHQLITAHWGEMFTVGDNDSCNDGNQTGNYEWLYIWPDGDQYDVASGTPLAILYETGDLVENVTYLIEWSVGDMESSNGSSVIVASANMTFTADANWSSGLLESNISLNDGCYDVWADLYDADDGHHFGYDGFTFCVGMSNTSQNYPYVIAGTDYTDYDVGDTVHAVASSHDLTFGQNYSLYWTLTASDSTVDSGNFSWTAFGSWSQETINWSGLGVDWHCFNVDLYEENATGSQWLDSDNACFSVGDHEWWGPEYIIADWMDFNTGDGEWGAYELDENFSYYVTVEHFNQTGLYSSYTTNFSAPFYSSDFHVDGFGLGSPPDGCYDWIFTLYNASGEYIDHDDIQFVIGYPPCNGNTTGNEVIVIWPGGHDYTIEVGEPLDVLYEVDYLSANGSYLIEWDISTTALGSFDSGSLQVDPTSPLIGSSQHLIDNVSYMFSAGCYEVWAGLYGDGTLLVDDWFTLCVEDPLPVDSDGDSIPDVDDQCPGTPAGTPVDSVGCPESPADGDGDGVPDGDDLCLGTPAGTPVDSTGCSEAPDAGNETGGDDTSGDDDGAEPEEASGGLLPGFTTLMMSISILMALAFHARNGRRVGDIDDETDCAALRTVRDDRV